jgi:hypothetical protein
MKGKPQNLSKGQQDDVIRILRKKLLAWVLICFTILAGLTGASLFGIMRRTEKKMEALVAKQFEEPRIQAVVSEVAAERASTLMIEQITPEVARFKTEVAKKNEIAEEKLKTLDNSIAKASATLGELESVTEYTKTVVAAQNDDRKAFDKLKEWSEDKNNPFSSKAAQAWNTIYESHNEGMYKANFPTPWNESVDPSKFLLPKLIQQYKGALAQLRPALLEYIWKRDDIPKVDRLDFMIETMKHDSSLTAVEYAGRHFTAGTGLKIKPSAVEYLVPWWNGHRQEYIGK